MDTTEIAVRLGAKLVYQLRVRRGNLDFAAGDPLEQIVQLLV